VLATRRLKNKDIIKIISSSPTRKEANHVTKTVVANGPAVEIIIRVAEKENADIIAMASHGGGGLTRVFYGSVAAGVLNRVNRPLLIVRSRQEE
jgi:nucleotide-binding universal stress UspA family protein